MSEPTLSAWRTHFEQRESDCPWPGGRSLRRGQPLTGRDDDRRRFLSAVKGHKLVLLSGPSGVGKSSLLDAGLVPDLESENEKMAVLTISDWSVSSERTGDVRRFLEDKLRAGMIAPQPGDLDAAGWASLTGVELTNETPILATLNSALGERGVLVLDQFEELIRYSRVLKDQVFAFLALVVERMDIRIVISFRSEFLYEFRSIENAMGPFTLTRFPIDDIEDEWALEVIKAPDPKERHIAHGEAQRLAELWQEERSSLVSRAASTLDPAERVSVLHLQAMLYVLYFASVDQRIDHAVIDRLEANGRLVDALGDVIDRPAAHASSGRGALFRQALASQVALKLRHCRDACRASDIGVDEFLIEGTNDFVRRIAPHLSSAGYKLNRERWDLARVSLGGEYESLDRASDLEIGDYTAIFRSLESARVHPEEIDLLSAPAIDIARAETVEAAIRSRLATRLAEMDQRSVTCGPVSGLPATRVLIEELRRFTFAVEWLRASSLVRITNPGDNPAEAVVSIIHDGFGGPLCEWADALAGDTKGPLHAFTAPRGANYEWAIPLGERPNNREPDVGSDAGITVLPNLRWRGGWVRGDFRHVVFVNCDFRGTVFDQCRLRGVTFMNCLLDGTLLSDCRIEGSLEPLPSTTQWNEVEPLMRVAAPLDQVRQFGHYRGLDRGSIASWEEGGVEVVGFYSGLPGSAAVPWGGQATTHEDDAYPIGNGGVVVYGSRLSGLVVRKCVWDPGSGLGLRHTTGSGLEVVEIDGTTRIDVYGSALRQLTFTSEPGHIGLDDALDVRIEHSFISQLWVGGGLRDAVTGQPGVDLRDCTVLQAFNASHATVASSAGLVCLSYGVDTSTSDIWGPEVNDEELASIFRSGALEKRWGRADYVRDPSEPRAH